MIGRLLLITSLLNYFIFLDVTQHITSIITSIATSIIVMITHTLSCNSGLEISPRIYASVPTRINKNPSPAMKPSLILSENKRYNSNVVMKITDDVKHKLNKS